MDTDDRVQDSGLDTVDSYVARILVDTARMAKLMGATAVLVGMRPEVAETAATRGVSLIISVDTGIRAAEVVRRASELETKRSGKRNYTQRRCRRRGQSFLLGCHAPQPMLLTCYALCCAANRTRGRC